MLALLALAPVVSAAVLVPRGAPTEAPGALGFDYPPYRGWSADTANVEPCGGYALGGRTDFPLTGGQIATEQLRDGDNVAIMYSSSSDPQSYSDFSSLLPNVTKIYPGTGCFATPDFAALGLSAGDEVTLMLTMQTGPRDTQVYQCADVTLVAESDFTPIEEYTCANVTTSTQTRGSANTAAASSSSSSSSSSSPVSPLGAGFIGAACAIVLAAALLTVAKFTGFARFGKKRAERVRGDHESMSSSIIPSSIAKH